MEGLGRATRTTALAAVFLAVLMLGVPSFMAPHSNSTGATGTASATNGSRIFIVGQQDMSWQTLSPFLYTSAAEMMTIWPCYSTMLTYDLDGKTVIGDLATSWTMSSDGLTWTFNLANNAYFISGAAPNDLSHPVTATDVMFTYWQIANYTNNLHSYLGPVQGVPLIASMTAPTQYQVVVRLSVAYAPFLGALTAIPIVPKYYWLPHADVKGDVTGWTGALPVGSGPWYYGLTGLPSTGESVMKRNSHWFQMANRGWDIHVDELRYRAETDASSAWLELTTGQIDVFIAVPSSMYVQNIVQTPTPNVVGWAQSTGFVYEFNMNQITPSLRNMLGGGYARSSSNWQLLTDPIVKRAMAMSINKPGFIADVLEGLGTPADSLCPDVNPWHYTYGSKAGETPIPFDTVGARGLLNANGWNLDGAGLPAGPTQTPLYKNIAGTLTPLTLKFYTLNTDPQWAIGANLIKGWAAQSGIFLDMTNGVKSYAQISQDWMSANYDTWLWDWMFSPTSDISTDVLSVVTTMELTTWQDVFWSNPTYDDLYNRSLVAMDPAARRQITDQMQRMLYENMGCQLVAYRKELYAASTLEWTGYGDWAKNFLLMPDQLAPYLYMQISPNGPDASPQNQAPVVTFPATGSGEMKRAMSFSVTATDVSSLTYTWYWGDGTAPETTTTRTNSHTYQLDGYYTVWVSVREVGSPDLFATSASEKVTIVDTHNRVPTGVDFTFQPATPDSGDLVYLNATATDPDGDPMTFTWNFGDTFSAMGQRVTHQFKTAGSYSVLLSVTDGRAGHNPVNMTHVVPVTANGIPSVSTSSTKVVVWKTANNYTATMSDDDALRLTWVWGDGSKTVQNLALGTTTSTLSHTYSTKGLFNLVIYADDRTGLDGHNMSATCSVSVKQSLSNSAPTITAYTATPLTVNVGDTVTFTGSAKDADVDAMRFSFKFGDGAWNVTNQPAGLNANSVITVVTTHQYYTAGTYITNLYVWDYYNTASNKTSAPVTITVNQPNRAPNVVPLNPVSGTAGQPVSMTVSAADPDGDTLKYTWDFGDSTAKVVGTSSATHTYVAAGAYNYSVSVDDAHGHNVTVTSTASIAKAMVGYGQLRVATNPACPSMISIDGQWASRWGLDWVKLTPGPHMLSFGDVVGMISPAPVLITIVDGEVTTYTAQFTAMGSLRVITNPAMPSTVYVDGVPRNDWGFWNYVPAGTYTVSFGAVAGFDIPAPQTVTVTAGGYGEVTGNFVANPSAPGPDPASYGMLRVTTNPAVPTMVMLNGEWMSHWGLNWVKLAPGNYTLAFTDVQNAITPAPRTVTITAGQTTTVDAVFNLAGVLRVMTSPAMPSTIYVDGIPRNDWGIWTDVAPGTYVVSFGAVAGFVTPAPQTVTVVASGYTEVTGVFVAG